MALNRQDVIEKRSRFLGTSNKTFFRSSPLMIVRGEGSKLYDDEDREYLDCINNVCHVGHCDAHVVEAISTQAAMLNTNSRFLSSKLVEYAERLLATFPPQLSKVFVVNSGSEANDLALRLAQAHTGSRDVITLDHAYHGHLTSLIDISPYKWADSDDELQRSGREHVHVAPNPDTYRGKFTDLTNPGDDLGEKYAEEVNGIIQEMALRGRSPGVFIAESMQSCAGQIIFPDGYLREVYRLVHEAGGVCIADEVQVGFGRVGTHWWAFQTQGPDVIPDIVTLGKPMGNGFPVAAVVTTDQVCSSFVERGVQYFNTYGGSTLSCAAALAMLEVMETRKLLDHCKHMEEYLKRKICTLTNKHLIIGDVRIKGMFFGLELVKDRQSREPATAAAEDVLNRLKEERVLMSVDGPRRNVIKFKPPMVFSEADADRMVSALDTVLGQMEQDLLQLEAAAV